SDPRGTRMNDELRQFVFKGILARHAIVDLELEGLLHKPAIGTEGRSEVDLFASVQQTIRNSSIQMQRAYRILYVLENIVRDLIVSRFSEPDGSAWFDKRANSAMKTESAREKSKKKKTSGTRVETKTKFITWISGI
ncbi:MAG TPA: hypothetical protein VK813_11520, partial [Edaphobacter sp.]|nr:hypothetical protein [Edaphobacter sp.]